MKRVIFPLITMAVLLLSSCKKTSTDSNNGNGTNPNCPLPLPVTITTNSPVIVGAPLTLTADDDQSYLFHWTGPNGFNVDYQAYASNAGEQGIAVTTYADSGLYKLSEIDPEGCVAYQGTVDVQIIPAPSQPCNVDLNTSTSTVIGVGGTTYTDVSTTTGTGYTFDATDGYEDLNINFNSVPTPGIYQTSGYFAMDNSTVGLWINESYAAAEYVANPGSVYVTLVGGKLEVGFCDITFVNQDQASYTPIVISARIIQK